MEAIRIAAKAGSRLFKRLKEPAARPKSLPAAELDGAHSDRARHHLRAYRFWFERLRVHGIAGLPPLDLLHAELLGDVDKRPSYPVFGFSTPMHPVVSIVIPVRDQCEITFHCLCSLLFAYNDTPFEVIVVDNGSSDETTTLGNFMRGIKIVRLASSQTFSCAVDHGVRLARGEFVLVLNNGSEVTSRWLDELVAVFRNFEHVGIARSKTVYSNRELQKSGRAIWTDNSSTAGRGPGCDYLRKVNFASGAALMTSRALWDEVGGFGDERAPACPSNLALKVRAKGRFVVFVPTSVVFQMNGDPGGTAIADKSKAYQNTARPKLPGRDAMGEYGSEGESPDREVAFRVLFIEQEFPLVDHDAGSYAAFQEMRLFQALGAKVSFLPRNLAWMGRHTIALQRIGVECLFTPYVSNFAGYVRQHANNYDLVYVARHKIAEEVIPLVREVSSGTKIIFNLADLHFLREQREAALGSEGYSVARAAKTRRRELAVITASDLTFSYSDVELGILAGEVTSRTRLAKMPWVVDCRPRTVPFAETRDILFVGGFAHPPNATAVTFFVRKVMPLLQERLPDVVFNVVGSGAEAAVAGLSSDRVRIIGHVPNVREWLDRTRVFVAPLLAGAGLKGKVLDALAHGVPSVLSPIAAEGTGLVHEAECLIAESADAWAECIARLYHDEDLWSQLTIGALRAAKSRFSFSEAVSILENELAGLGLTSRRDWGLAYRFARPDRYVT
ncbi:MAG: glycosyltransferase [Rhizomicrobium sp.]